MNLLLQLLAPVTPGTLTGPSSFCPAPDADVCLIYGDGAGDHVLGWHVLAKYKYTEHTVHTPTYFKAPPGSVAFNGLIASRFSERFRGESDLVVYFRPTFGSSLLRPLFHITVLMACVRAQDPFVLVYPVNQHPCKCVFRILSEAEFGWKNNLNIHLPLRRAVVHPTPHSKVLVFCVREQFTSESMFTTLN